MGHFRLVAEVDEGYKLALKSGLMTKKHIIYIIVIGSLVGGAFSSALLGHRGGTAISPGGSHNGSRSVAAVDSHGPDTNDPRNLMGMTHEVFVGKVLRIVGNESFYGRPCTQFEVRPIYSIKGNLQGTVVLCQLHTWPLAQVGSTYVFASVYQTSFDWYMFWEPTNYRLLSDDATLSDAELKALAESSTTVQALQQAYPNEIISRYSETYNSYASRHYDAAGQLIDDTVELHKQFLAAHASVTPAVESTK